MSEMFWYYTINRDPAKYDQGLEGRSIGVNYLDNVDKVLL